MTKKLSGPGAFLCTAKMVEGQEDGGNSFRLKGPNRGGTRKIGVIAYINHALVKHGFIEVNARFTPIVVSARTCRRIFDALQNSAGHRSWHSPSARRLISDRAGAFPGSRARSRRAPPPSVTSWAGARSKNRPVSMTFPIPVSRGCRRRWRGARTSRWCSRATTRSTTGATVSTPTPGARPLPTTSWRCSSSFPVSRRSRSATSTIRTRSSTGRSATPGRGSATITTRRCCRRCKARSTARGCTLT